MAWTRTQQVVVAIVPKCSAFLSILGSSCIIYEVLVFDRRKLSRVYHRLLLTMSLYDVIESSWNFCSSWPIPKNTPNIAFASGTTATCTFQGFILQFGLAIPILNMCLSIYYLLVIKYSWSDEKIRKRVEWMFHAGALTMSLGFCFASLWMDLFNNANLWCWIAPLPLDCLDSYRYGDEAANCIRGDNAWIYRWAFYYAELWFCILFVMLTMMAVYFEVRRLEAANHKYQYERSMSRGGGDEDTSTSRRRLSFTRRSSQTTSNLEDDFRNASQQKKPSKSRRVATQALWYVGAFYLTFLFATINRLIQQVANKTYFAMTVLHTIFEPSQGFLNYLVYIRPRYISYREKNPETSRFMAFRRIIFPDEEQSKARKASRYVDEDHEDEEGAKEELSRWRRGIFGRRRPSQTISEVPDDQPASLRDTLRASKRASGIFRFIQSEKDAVADIENAVDGENEDPTTQTHRLSEKLESSGDDDDEQEQEQTREQDFSETDKTEISGSGNTDNGCDERHRRTVSFQLDEDRAEQN